MLKLSIHLVIWLLMFLFLDAVVTENKNHSNLQEKKTLAPNSQNSWEKGLLRKHDSSRLISSTEMSQFEGGRIKYKRAMKNENEKTLLDYNGPAITEDSDIRSDQIFANHVRVKRSESNDCLPHFWFKNNTIYTFGELSSSFEKPCTDSNHKLESDMIDTTTRTYLRHKREVLSKTKQHRKRVKGNTRHSKYRIQTQARGKKRGTLKSRKFPTKKSSSEQRGKANMHSRKIDESQTKSKMKKRESENSGLNGDVVGADSIDEGMRADKSETLTKQSEQSEQRQEENSVVLPFVQTGKAKLRVRIEKIPADESSFINTDSWINNSTTIGLSSTVSIQSKYETLDEIDTNVTSSKLAPNFDYTGRKRKDVDNTIELTSSAIKADPNSEDGKYKLINEKVAEFANEDMKYRAKRNQEIMSKRYPQSDTNARRLKRFKNTEQNIGSNKHKRIMYKRERNNRAVRSIEEIKDLVEKLVVKVNELQIYVSNYSETPHPTDSCIGKKADHASKLLEKSDYKSEFVRDTGSHGHLTNNQQAISVEEKASQMPSSVSRVTRANSWNRRKSLRKWNRWTDWSSCSVTCGKGRQIRWRHCLRDCDDAEIEMEEKACQLPACPPGKFLGIF